MPGLCLDATGLGELHDAIAGIRQRAGFKPSDQLKFQNSSRPRGMDAGDWNNAKGEVIAACRTVGASFLAVVIHHEIAAGKKDKLIDWQLNTLLTKFDQNYLGSMYNDVGMVVMDRIENGREYALMKEKFTQGGVGASPRTFPHVIGYAGTCDGASHIASAADIVLGTFGFLVNKRGDVPLTKRLAHEIWPLIWHPVGASAWGDGIMLVPWNIRVPRYAKAYNGLQEHLN